MNGDQRIQNRKERKCNTRSEMVTWAETDPQETDWWSWTWKCYSLNWGTPSVTHLNPHFQSSHRTLPHVLVTLDHFPQDHLFKFTVHGCLFSSPRRSLSLSAGSRGLWNCPGNINHAFISPPPPSTSPPPPQPVPPAGSLAVISLSASSVGWIPASSWGKRARLIECHNISSPGSSVF